MTAAAAVASSPTCSGRQEKLAMFGIPILSERGRLRDCELTGPMDTNYLHTIGLFAYGDGRCTDCGGF